LPRDWAVKDAGVIRASLELSVSQRLALIHKSVIELMREFNPDQIAIERAFHGKNPSSSIKLGEARGVLIGAASACGLPVMEYSPSHIKMTVAGFGNASKEQVALALQTILKFSRGALPADASDAVAIALTCGIAMSGTLGSKLSSQRFSDSNSRSR